MPVAVFAGVVALLLLVRRTWKASKKRRTERQVTESEIGSAEDGA